MLKSILRMDEDQCARRVAQKYLRVVDPDYYEFESKNNSKPVQTHIGTFRDVEENQNGWVKPFGVYVHTYLK